mmetsp:Transcript_3885/g.10171  ORF Transcript_3885/g.10171 Transcript_3885/m.10171 type:complete len:271 (+) Transcript_3885:213-1025(+)|eukprot:CAMPEP_0197191316 /NCGR_PEP_ID=MMETSP1423-20130617/23145_1 /TAXON_ID=476441 /ORGANISM="Pseudo-nitzschia heimii, Strain UNC1101" /LENGTH=270 /DNA_ID=CAMNT_0042643915 /DNA_START=108 /DNA_END=920 /DNA_ORIENTATION=-
MEDHIPYNADELYSQNGTDILHKDGIDDHSTLGFVEEDDSFLANNSLCKQHRSTLHMLDSLRKEVVNMVRNDDPSAASNKSPPDVTIDLSNSTDISSPLVSPLLSRRITPISSNNRGVPNLINNTITPSSNTGPPPQYPNNDDATFCSMDHSINNEMEVLKEVSKDFEQELKAENLDTVFEAIERIGKSDNATRDGFSDIRDTDVIGETTHNEILNYEQKNYTLIDRRLLDAMDFFRSIEWYSTNIKFLVASIIISFLHKYILSRQESVG